ncbi:hypothetical protein [Chakrabartyella piscis]|uniref:hypothetical protein n=1 Tax=Chakrabartyella piscis TaxID=2918914 RepID=UPI002958BD52|nr:hypothetical protein [Chakrabartyella piscis]
MRILSQEGIFVHCLASRHGTHNSKRVVHGQTHHFSNNGTGKKQNLDYETIHHRDI